MQATRRPRINIISWDSGGLGTDIDVLTQALGRAGCDVYFKGRRHRRARNRAHSLLMTAVVVARQRWAAISGRPRFDMNLFIESIFPEYLQSARVNCLFVNLEWFRDENLAHLARLDWLLCKTPSAVDTCRDLGVPCRHVAFTSPDKRIPQFVRPANLRCLHLSGQSAVKGTEAVIDAWSRHPEWPQLTVVRRSLGYGGERASPLQALPNVHYETDYVPPDRLRQLQNECAVHVIPSQAEGYGHVIGEGMSCGAVVVTTDAPPMNELVTAERGVLVRVARSQPMRRSTMHFVDVGHLEATLSSVFAAPSEYRNELGRNARSWYEQQQVRFDSALQELLSEIDVRSADDGRAASGGR